MKKPLALLALLSVSFLLKGQSGQAFVEDFITHSQAAYPELKTFQATVTMNMMGMQMPAKQVQDFRSGSIRMEIEMFGQKMVQVYDGNEGWLKMGSQPAAPMDAQMLLQMKAQQRQSRPDTWSKFVNRSSTYLGPDNSHGFSGHKIRVTVDDTFRKEYWGNPEMAKYAVDEVILFVEEGTYRVRRVEFSMSGDDKNLRATIVMNDWHVVDTYPFPHKLSMEMSMTSQAGGGSGTVPAVEIQYSDVLVNHTLPSGAFSKPE